MTTMKSGAKLKATEERLEEIREAAAEAAQVPAGVRPSVGSPQKREGESYYGLPALKPPVWTWEVPLYFFLGGIAGLSACIGFAAQMLHGAPELIRLCLWVGLLWLAEASAAVTGLLLASYTGVLIGATAVPVWSENRKLLPAHFLTSGLGGASGILELAGFLVPATQILGFAASGIETLIEIMLQVWKRPVDAPLHHGRSGRTLPAAGLLEGPAARPLRIFFGSVPAGRYAAAATFLLGALLSRYAWIWAGRASASDPQALFQLQRKS